MRWNTCVCEDPMNDFLPECGSFGCLSIACWRKEFDVDNGLNKDGYSYLLRSMLAN
jgi:hypothetical protein